MANRITIDYSPALDLNTIEAIARERFPQFKVKQVHRLRDWVCIRKNSFVSANILIKHKPKKGTTKLTINGNCDFWVIFFLGGLWHYFVRGNFMSQIKSGIIQGLQYRYGNINFY
ncbi:MAG: hypothetical protein IKW83_09235 [Muribaculaceae bacterium]|nr:hypothetical protein [Muribaculaceae bacterium]